MSQESDLRFRAEQRAKYFEDPNYFRWSDVVDREDESYGSFTERAFLAQYLSQDKDYSMFNITSLVKEFINNHRDKQQINWHAIYAYLDERDKTTPSWLSEEVRDLHSILDSIREELSPSIEYAAF